MTIMANELKKIIIITTKNYPLGGDWRNGKPIDINCLDKIAGQNGGIIGLIAKLDFDGNVARQKNFEKNLCAKVKTFKNGAWSAYIVPCTIALNSEQKSQYIEYILQLYSEGMDVQNVYFVAHEKDFDNYEGVKGELAKEKHIPTIDCVLLKKLVAIGHAYMFQHGNSNDIGEKVIPKLNDGFEETEFEKVLDTIDAEWKMNEFFTMVNKDPANRYPSKNTTTPTP